MDADLSASGSSTTSTFADTLAIGDEAEGSESERCVAMLSKAPRLTSTPLRGCGKSGGKFKKSCNIHTNFTAEGIFSALKDTMESNDLCSTRLLSFTSDNCSVMKGVCNGVIAKLQLTQPKIFDVLCIFHLFSFCIKSAVEALPIMNCLLVFTITFQTVCKQACILEKIMLNSAVLNSKAFSSTVKLDGSPYTGLYTIY